MKKLYIGCGGWAYWQVDRVYRVNSTQLADYATVFNFVEVNNTFYQIPPLELVQSWRNQVPQEFQFAVKCHRQVSHTRPLVLNESNFKIMEKMEKICKILKAIGLVIQTPHNFRPTAKNLRQADKFFSYFKDTSFELIWEPRGEDWLSGPIKEKLSEILSKNKVTHCTDISRSLPLYSANIAYTRVFGKGQRNQWQFDDEEIRLLHERALELPGSATYVTFHTQRQTHDAARLKAFDETGRLINTTGKYEINSMMVAIDEYRKYPITKQELLAAHGWKIIDISENKRIRAQKILEKLPNIEFKTKNELKFYLERIFRGKEHKKLEEFDR
ncbi:MAG: DUF72 domain-containing protein [Candidatus Helarchaeota archaeon]